MSRVNNVFLKPKTNIILIFTSSLAVFVAFYFSPTSPILLLVISSIFGLLAGIMQVLCLQTSQNTFGSASSMQEFARVLAANKWGRRYQQFYKISNLIFLVLSLYFFKAFPFNFIVAYFSFALLRDIVTLKSIFDLQKISKR